MHRTSATSVGGNGAAGQLPAAGVHAPAAEWPTLGLRGARAGSDASHYRTPPLIWLFQPTPPVRGATDVLFALRLSSPFQPTLPVRGATKDGIMSQF